MASIHSTAMQGKTEFVCATGPSPRLRLPWGNSAIRGKKTAGAHFVTQPVYEAERIEQFLADAAQLELPVMLGLCPLASYRNARFLTDNVPGMRVPDDILKRMARAEEAGRGQEEGIAIARETLKTFRDRISGAYIMPQFGRHKVAMAVLDGFIDPPHRPETPGLPATLTEDAPEHPKAKERAQNEGEKAQGGHAKHCEPCRCPNSDGDKDA